MIPRAGEHVKHAKTYERIYLVSSFCIFVSPDFAMIFRPQYVKGRDSFTQVKHQTLMQYSK